MRCLFSKIRVYTSSLRLAKNVYLFLRKKTPIIFLFSYIRKKYRSNHFRRNFGYIHSSLLEGKGEFSREFAAHSGLTSQKWSHYLEIYDDLIPKLRLRFGNKIHVLEIGIQRGGSLQIWRRIFGAQAEILGIDIDPYCSFLEVDAKIMIGSAVDSEFSKKIIAEMTSVDFIIDDGSHDSQHQRKTFELLFPYLSQNGIYVIEDTEHSYYWSKHGGYLRYGAIMQRVKRLLDQMNKVYYRSPALKSFDIDVNLVKSVTFMQGIILIEKGVKNKSLIAVAGSENMNNK